MGRLEYGKYDAMDVAEWILFYYENKFNRTMNNIKLQKILYYVFKEYLRDTNELLFDNEIEAWSYGPVVPDVYYTYNNNMFNNIKGVVPQRPNLIDHLDKEFIVDIVLLYINIKVWDLVDKVQKEKAYTDAYIKGRRERITTADILDAIEKEEKIETI